ncbi:uncharacterized protein TNCV_2542951 [Trichonephila clavipes]|nr:uncharacterized protein TNCV_2542951 [Trichonephila clavipes]
MISSFVEDNHENWDQFLKEFAYALRTVVHESTGKTSAELFLGRKLIIPFQKSVIVTDGAEFMCGNIEKLFEEARRNTKIQQEQWAKYYNKSREVNVKVKDWDKRIRKALQVRIYHQRERDEDVVESEGSGNSRPRVTQSEGLDNNRSKATHLETEGNIGLVRERNSVVEQWWQKRGRSEGSTESSPRLEEPLHKRRPAKRTNRRKRGLVPRHSRTIITAREGQLEATGSTRGQYHPLFHPVLQIERRSGERIQSRPV